MLVDVHLHSASAALHWKLSSGSAAAVHIIQAGHSLSALDSTSAHLSAEP
jgi:hypothetical protein